MSSDETPSLPTADPVTLLDVARSAGVSAATVSRILNGTARVAPAKVDAVQQAIARLNFKPNLFARSLKTGVTMTVGVLTQSLESQFYAHALKGIEVGLEGSGFSPIITSGHWSPQTDLQSLRVLTSRRVDGLIILTGTIDDAAACALAREQPVVLTERALQAPNLYTVQLDQFHGGYLATRHLVELGHRRIAHITGVAHRRDAMERQRGYEHALREAGITPDPALCVQGDFTDQGGLRAMHQLLQRGVPFSAVFCANDESAMGARLALFERGVRVPEEVSLVGFDDLPVAAFMTPPLSSVHQPVFEIGLHAAQALLRLLGREVEPAALPALRLVVRGSSAAPPGG
ncbi:MAG: LacI family DNA-binding transcriptional regulator [Rhodoferax sp.]